MNVVFLTQDSRYGELLITYLGRQLPEWTFQHFQLREGSFAIGNPDILIVDWDHQAKSTRQEVTKRLRSKKLRPKIIVLMDRKTKKGLPFVFNQIECLIVYKSPNGREDLLEVLKPK